MKRPTILSTLFFVVMLLVSSLASASFTKSLWPRWEVHNPLSTAVISHQEWQYFLSQSVMTNQEGINLINYPHLTNNAHRLLDNYLARMSAIDIQNYNRKEQLAYWLNVYNALTVHTIIKYYPVTSIQEINISPGLFSIGPWGANLFSVNNYQLSLEDIHNRIIRPIWNDPRTHYAINNGSIGAANIPRQAYQGNLLDDQLNAAAREYINSLRGVQVIEGKLIVSKLYYWFLEDFGGTEQDLIEHLIQFSDKPLAQILKKIDSISTYTYNWHVNSTFEASQVAAFS